jgi:hypothetical protein
MENDGLLHSIPRFYLITMVVIDSLLLLLTARQPFPRQLLITRQPNL